MVCISENWSNASGDSHTTTEGGNAPGSKELRGECHKLVPPHPQANPSHSYLLNIEVSSKILA